MKGNRQTRIEEAEKQKFINLGFKIAKLEKNKLVYEEVETEESKEIEKLKEENEALKGELESLKEQQASEDVKTPSKVPTKATTKATETKGEGK